MTVLDLEDVVARLDHGGDRQDETHPVTAAPFHLGHHLGPMAVHVRHIEELDQYGGVQEVERRVVGIG
ncbi:hypothetical protein [Streptomyces sp. NPDC018031]|uniref:hypothetical protein n=1 Tax=Streptomyces sp. NPDC018031 TaxID=3365033 RepID=UPI0037B45D1D